MSSSFNQENIIQHEIKSKQNHLTILLQQYEAAYNQLDTTLEETNKVSIRAKISDYEREIKRERTEIEELEKELEIARSSKNDIQKNINIETPSHYLDDPPSSPSLSLIGKVIDFLQSQFSLRLVIIHSSVTILVIGLRLFGLLQSFEFAAFDQMMRLRKSEDNPDNRLLVVEINQDDIDKYGAGNKKQQASLPDLIYEKLFEKLEKYEPRTIGLDIYRPFPVMPEQKKLTKILQKDNFFAVCKIFSLESTEDISNVAPPPEIKDKFRLGFSDFDSDRDDVVRRHLLQIEETPSYEENKCSTTYSFSLQLALHYLNKELDKGRLINCQDYKNVVYKDEQICNVSFKPIEAFMGGYRLDQLGGDQVLLNYRSLPSGQKQRSPREIAYKINLDDILNDRVSVPVQKLKDRIILIGIHNDKDSWLTPYGDKMPGVWIHAQMVSQILSSVLDGRSLLQLMPWWGDCFWIAIWSLLGVIAWKFRRWSSLLIAQGVALGILCLICFFLFIADVWLPLVPPAIAFVGTSVIIFFIPNPQEFGLADI